MGAATGAFSRIEPRSTHWKLVFKDNQRNYKVFVVDSTGAVISTYGPVGGLSCPVVVAEKKGIVITAFSDLYGRKSGSELVAYCISDTSKKTLLPRRPDIDHIWLLKISSDEKHLAAFSMCNETNRYGESYLSVLDLEQSLERSQNVTPLDENQIQVVDLEGAVVSHVSLPKEVFAPLAISFRNEILICSATGTQLLLVNFAGEICKRIDVPDMQAVTSAAYNPEETEFIFSSESTYVVRPEKAEPVRLIAGAQSASYLDAERVIYSRTQSDLGLHDRTTDTDLLLVKVDSVDPEFRGYLSKPHPSPDGRYVVTCLSWMRHLTEEERQKAKRFTKEVAADGGRTFDWMTKLKSEHSFCIASIETGEYWMFPGYSDYVEWL